MKKKYDDKKSTAKVIDLEPSIRKELEIIALEEHTDLKNLIQDTMTIIAINHIKNKEKP